MSKGSKKRPRDTNQLAKFITDVATGEVDDELTPAQKKARKAGKAGGKARASSLSSEERSKIAKAAARARWSDDDS